MYFYVDTKILRLLETEACIGLFCYGQILIFFGWLGGAETYSSNSHSSLVGRAKMFYPPSLISSPGAKTREGKLIKT